MSGYFVDDVKCTMIQLSTQYDRKEKVGSQVLTRVTQFGFVTTCGTIIYSLVVQLQCIRARRQQWYLMISIQQDVPGGVKIWRYSYIGGA
jgi:hypothetical protein